MILLKHHGKLQKKKTNSEAWEYIFILFRSLLTTLTCVAEASSPDCCSHCCRCGPGNHWDLHGRPAGGHWRRYWSVQGYWAKANCSLPRQPSGWTRSKTVLACLPSDIIERAHLSLQCLHTTLQTFQKHLNKMYGKTKIPKWPLTVKIARTLMWCEHINISSHSKLLHSCVNLLHNEMLIPHVFRNTLG